MKSVCEGSRGIRRGATVAMACGFAASLMSLGAGCESSQQRAERSADRAEQRTVDRAGDRVDEAVDRGIDGVLGR